MKPQYFLDSSFVVSFIDESDVRNKEAVAIFEEITSHPHDIFISDLVINEVENVLARRCESRKKPHLFQILSASFEQQVMQVYPVLCVYELLPEKIKPVLEIMKEHKARLSFHDSLIVFFLRQVPEVTLVTFDEDFEKVAGLKILS